MNSIVKTLHIASRSSLKTIKNRNYTKNIWDVAAIDLLHNDFDNIQKLKNDTVELPLVITEIPPPFCPRCCKYVKKNKCSFSPFDDMSIDYFVNE